MNRNIKLDYIEFDLLDDFSVRADFHLIGSFVCFVIPIIDDYKSFDMLTDILGLMAKSCVGDYHVQFKPSFYRDGYLLVSHANVMRLPFKAPQVDDRSVMYKLCQIYSN